MNDSILEKHSPYITGNILGCDGFEYRDSIFCIMINGEHNFINYGITEDTIVFADREKNFIDGDINVYRLNDGTYKLSRSKMKADFKGRVIMSFNVHDE